jgi:membrane-associated phospholipid phosphatase
MNRWRIGLVLSCCLLAGNEAMRGNCYAQSLSQSDQVESSATDKAEDDHVPKSAKDSGKDPSKEDSDSPVGANSSASLPQLFKNLVGDQKAIWTSPAKLRLVDADWLLPLGTATGIMLATDSDVMRHLSNSPSRINNSKSFANYGVAAFVGAGAGLYVWGHFTHDDHKRETGFLAAEAALNSLAVTYAGKYASGRERPLEDNFNGKFWQSGDSFPSEHASAAWSIASVIAHEYPGTLTSIFAYGGAAAISASRITGKQHFPTDVLIGSTIGWFVGQQVYRHHHDPELGGGSWQTYAESREEGPGRSSASVGSPFVELDSWIYPAIERLAAFGYIHSEFLGMRPWTRLECAQLVQEAGEAIQADGSVPDEAVMLYTTLESEFSPDLERMGGGGEAVARVESIYSNVMGISGPPLNDSYHFGQTIINNYGRPYQEGFNTYDGFSGYGTAGRYTIYVRGEYQHAPSAPAYPLSVREVIAEKDHNPLQPATPFATVDQFRLLDTYVASNFGGWNFSFGKQSLWWGPGDGTAMLFSDNAEPIYMFRMSPISSFTIPGLSRVLGPFKTDFFVGKLSGNEFPPRPAMHGEKISFKPLKDWEFGFSRTVEFGGVGRPLTAGAIWNSYVSTKSSVNYPADRNPGKRSSSVDSVYRIPFRHNWLTLYADSIAADDVTPLTNPPRSAWMGGIYMARLPKLPKVDLRIEGGYTDVAIPQSINGNFTYYDSFYHDAYTNKTNILGSWIGREGQGIQAKSTYWFGARNSLEFAYRHGKVSKDFIPSGETVNDGSVRLNWWRSECFTLSSMVQYEKWYAPLLASTPQTNWTSSVEVEFLPQSWRITRK